MARARRNRLTNPTSWWALSAAALLAAVLDILTRTPVEIAGLLVVVAAAGVLGAALCTRHRRLAPRRKSGISSDRGTWPDRSTRPDRSASVTPR